MTEDTLTTHRGQTEDNEDRGIGTLKTLKTGTEQNGSIAPISSQIYLLIALSLPLINTVTIRVELSTHIFTVSSAWLAIF